MNNYQTQVMWDNLNNIIGFATSIMVVAFMIGMVKRTSSAFGSPQLQVGTTKSREEIATARWNEILKYSHTLNDIKRIANREGIIKLYHGCPTEFAELLIKEGPRVPYKIEDTARYVARIYGLSWYEFRPYAYRAHEIVEKLSTATAPVAARWAWSFPLGEVLTDLNSHARMFVASKGLARKEGISIDDAYEQLHNKAIGITKLPGYTGPRYTFESAPDILGLPDKLALKAKTGALVEMEVDARALPDYIVLSAKQELEMIGEEFVGEYWSEQDAVISWNHNYRDIKIAPGNIKLSRIVISNMQPWEQDIIEDLAREKDLSVMHPTKPL